MGRRYVERHGYAPDALHDSKRKQTRLALKALDSGTGWLCRLAQAGPGLKVGLLDLKRLKISHLESEENLWNHESIAEIKAALRIIMVGPSYARIECGSEARHLHVHVLTHEALKGAPCKLEPVKDLFLMARYFYKPAGPNDYLAIGIHLEGKRKAFDQGRTLPRLAFSRGIPRL